MNEVTDTAAVRAVLADFVAERDVPALANLLRSVPEVRQGAVLLLVHKRHGTAPEVGALLEQLGWKPPTFFVGADFGTSEPSIALISTDGQQFRVHRPEVTLRADIRAFTEALERAGQQMSRAFDRIAQQVRRDVERLWPDPNNATHRTVQIRTGNAISGKTTAALRQVLEMVDEAPPPPRRARRTPPPNRREWWNR